MQKSKQQNVKNEILQRSEFRVRAHAETFIISLFTTLNILSIIIEHGRDTQTNCPHSNEIKRKQSQRKSVLSFKKVKN